MSQKYTFTLKVEYEDMGLSDVLDATKELIESAEGYGFPKTANLSFPAELREIDLLK